MAGVFQSSGHATDASKAEVLHDTIERIWRSFISDMLRKRDGTTFLTESEAVEVRAPPDRHLPELGSRLVLLTEHRTPQLTFDCPCS